VKLTGLLGGSFNPRTARTGAITLFAIEALGLDEVWWLVSPGNPLKPAKGMAPLAARFGSARRWRAARRSASPRSSASSARATRSTHCARSSAASRAGRFVWLMGADNLAQFHLWKDWREIAREMPIAVIARPGYDDAALASPAMAWLRRYRLTAARMKNRYEWSAPALIELRFDPDPRSATDVRRADPDWASRFPGLRPGTG
jgi:nicotinate-nucleotide adenylyltransferase